MSWQSMDNWKGIRPPNILSLDERIKVIQAYDKNPVYQKIANLFNCSSKQIRNIIANRESIIKYYGNSHEAKRIRLEKIAFLGKVMYEYILRAQTYDNETPLNIEIIRRKALEVRFALKIANFFPNTAWINNFMAEYGITDFETPVLDTNNARDIPPSVDANDIVLYVSERENPNFEIHVKPKSQSKNESGSSVKKFYTSISEAQKDYDEKSNFNYSDDVVDLESDNDDGDSSNQFYEPTINTTTTTSDEDCSEIQVNNYNEALEYLKPLEEFALLQENYRAIGIISQLEMIFKCLPTCNQS